MADNNVSDIYQGGYSSLKPTYGETTIGYQVSAGDFGLTTDFRSANIIQEVSSKLSSGVKHIEISPVSPDVFESIPKQHFKEARRQAKLVGATLTLHGSPQFEASGLTNQGFSEANRAGVERQMFDVIEKSHEINPKGSAPVVFHSSAGLPGEIPAKDEEGVSEALVINEETGSIGRIPIKKRGFPGEEGKATVEKELKKENERVWTTQLSNVSYHAERGGDVIAQVGGKIELLNKAMKEGGAINEQEYKQLKSAFNMGQSFLQDSYRGLKDLCETAHKEGNSSDKKMIEEYYNKIRPKVEEMKLDPQNKKNVLIMEEVVDDGLDVLNKLSSPPQAYQSLNQYAKDKSAQTFANLAYKSYKKFGNTAPIISVENPPAGMAFSTGKELRELMDKSREKFVEKAISEGMSRSDAQKQAEKLLGVTWDVGHINMLRKKGYETKHLIEETKAVAPLIKHVHLSDNFGFEHTELPMGMGNVPIKEMMKQIGKEGYEGKKIIEAGNWWQHFKTPPVKETLEAFGSPIYSMQMAPYWNQTLGYQQGYFGGMGEVLPQGHFETFGAGFSQLPAELGGQRFGGRGSRVSGRPME